MKIRLVSHASVVIETADAKIWTDPWLFGKAFNESWALLPEPEFDPNLYQEIDLVWVPHEHPDHFHFPTLKTLPADFKRRVTLLFQKNNSDKMPNAFRALGFENIRLLPNREIVAITPDTEVYCTQIGNMDSALGIRTQGEAVFNLNDCEANDADCRIIRRDLGEIHTVLNQFSIAGYRGHHDFATRLTQSAGQILENVLANHLALGAKITIPFASFVYFCMQDNRFINDFTNTPRTYARSSHRTDKRRRYPIQAIYSTPVRPTIRAKRSPNSTVSIATLPHATMRRARRSNCRTSRKPLKPLPAAARQISVPHAAVSETSGGPYSRP